MREVVDSDVDWALSGESGRMVDGVPGSLVGLRHCWSDVESTVRTPLSPHDLSPPTPSARLRRWAALDTTSGALLLVSAAIAVTWANSPWRESYHRLLEVKFGPASLH